MRRQWNNYLCRAPLGPAGGEHRTYLDNILWHSDSNDPRINLTDG